MNPPSTAKRVSLFGIDIDTARMTDAVLQVLDWVNHPEDQCRYVFTPNVDHVVMHHQNPELRAAYASASLVLADGVPVIWASRLLGRRLPERVAGSDLCPALFAAATMQRPLRVYLLGAGPGVAALAAEQIAARWPAVQVVGTWCPQVGFENDGAENQIILDKVRDAAPDLLIVGLGAPKQELWVHKHRDLIAAKAALCVGAAIDFLAGKRRRAPQWMQKAGLEWLHRLAHEPRRLVWRYTRDAWVFPQLLWREWLVRHELTKRS